MNAMTIRDMRSLTEQQQRFVDELVSTGCTPTEAARRADFASPGQEAYRLMRKPHVMAAIRETRERLISGTAANIAVQTLVEIMGDKTCPGSARVSAARTILDAAGDLNKDGRDDRRDAPLHEMTEAELRDFISRMEKAETDDERTVITIIPDKVH